MLKTGTDRNRGVPSSDQVPALTNVTPGCSEIWREAGAASAVCGLSPAQGMPTVPDLVLGSALVLLASQELGSGSAPQDLTLFTSPGKPCQWKKSSESSFSQRKSVYGEGLDRRPYHPESSSSRSAHNGL